MNKGTAQGDIEEINLVKELNRDKQSELWKILDFGENHNLFAVRCSSKKYSKVHESKESPKTDIFIIKTNDKIDLEDYFIDEKILERQNISFDYIENSGISVKERESKSFTYHKMSQEPFCKVFGNYELGCAIQYFVKESDFHKNEVIEEKWKTNEKKVKEKLIELKDIHNYEEELELNNYKEIKQSAISLTKHIINNDKNISDFIFRGVGAFENPFFVNYLYKEGKLIKDCYPSKYSITTGSGRSNGTSFTVVIKP
ncbi:hypothetical protein ACH5BK_06010 [Arcobacter sp. YIC-80]|uniref:hypothetical protein n=1 Tax=Arcobacter sp. YIC-80 TaxID=3376683 RepID=UPI00384F58D6